MLSRGLGLGQFDRPTQILARGLTLNKQSSWCRPTNFVRHKCGKNANCSPCAIVHTAPRLGGWWLPSPHPISCFGPKSMQMGQWGHLGHHLRFKCQSLVNSNLALATAGGRGKSYILIFGGPKKLPAGQRKFGKITPPP